MNYTLNKCQYILIKTKLTKSNMPNFQNGKIYAVRSVSRPDLIYIGSTTQPLAMRFGGHKKPSNKCSSKVIIDIGDAYIDLIENFPCSDKNELNARENHYMRELTCVNKQVALDTCPHGRQQNRCKDCGGCGICEHNLERKSCKKCDGSQICIHKRVRHLCVPCGGSQICEHKSQKNNCKICSSQECDFCGISCSKSNYKNHQKTTKHKRNYIAEYARIFEDTITEDQVPLF